MADQDGRHSEMIMQLLRHMTLSPHDVHAKGDISRGTIYPPHLIVIAFIFSELRRGCGIPPPPPPGGVEDQKKPDQYNVKLRWLKNKSTYDVNYVSDVGKKLLTNDNGSNSGSQTDTERNITPGLVCSLLSNAFQHYQRHQAITAPVHETIQHRERHHSLVRFC